MNQKPDGGYAFPQGLNRGDSFIGCEGMSLRDYFAARAPKRPQDWFRPVVGPKPIAPVQGIAGVGVVVEKGERTAEEHQVLERLMRSWGGDPQWDIFETCGNDDPMFVHVVTKYRNELKAYQARWLAFRQACFDWSVAFDRERLIQWPYAWADAVLAARNNNETKNTEASCASNA